MYVVAVRAPHVVPVHLALHEGPPDVHLLQDLPVRLVQTFLEQSRNQVIHQVGPAVRVVAELRAARVAGRAKLHLLAGCDPRRRHGQIVVGHVRASHRGKVGPLHMTGSRAVTRLAAHVDLGPRGLEGVGLGVVRFAQIRGVALRAHAVPRLGAARPVQPVIGGDVPIRIQVEPLFLLRVPRDAERLVATSGERDQVLLERLPTERVGDLELPHLAPRPLRDHVVSAVTGREAARDPPVLELRVPEIAAHGGRVRGCHRVVVIRADPRLRGLFVALGAPFPADERERRSRDRVRPPLALPALLNGIHRQREDDDRGGNDARDLPPAQRIADHARVTCDASNERRRRVRPVSTFTIPFSMRIGWRSRARGAGGLITSPRMS